MRAEKMFEKLGYYKIEHNEKIISFQTRYKYDTDIKIIFDLKNFFICKYDCTDNGFDLLVFTFDEILAIHKQIKELNLVKYCNINIKKIGVE